MKAPAVVSVLALAAAVAGCGSSSLSSSQLHSQATRLCSLAGTQTERVPTPGSPARSAAYLHSGIAIMKPELVALQRLHPPSDVADVYSNTVKTFSQKLAYLESTAQRIDRGADPVAAMRTLQERIGPLESQENGGWQALELPACLSR
jgi:hypothetical protein